MKRKKVSRWASCEWCQGPALPTCDVCLDCLSGWRDALEELRGVVVEAKLGLLWKMGR